MFWDVQYHPELTCTRWQERCGVSATTRSGWDTWAVPRISRGMPPWSRRSTGRPIDGILPTASQSDGAGPKLPRSLPALGATRAAKLNIS
jgi:hypothetical protein